MRILLTILVIAGVVSGEFLHIITYDEEESMQYILCNS